jgi:stage IV sporulation protein FB
MRIGKLEVTGGFLLLAAWLNYLDRQAIVPLALVACACHELGHYVAIRLLGGDIKQINLTAIGAEMVLLRPLCGWRECVAALAGPVVNLLLALCFSRWESGSTFVGLNLVLGCFNLMPVGRLDGGRVLDYILSLFLIPDLAQWIIDGVDALCGLLFLSVGLVLAWSAGNFTLLLVALWLLEIAATRKREEKSRK